METKRRVGLIIENGSMLSIKGFESLTLIFQNEQHMFRLNVGKVTHVPTLDLRIFSLRAAANKNHLPRVPTNDGKELVFSPGGNTSTMRSCSSLGAARFFRE